jgi:hypothetical protein
MGMLAFGWKKRDFLQRLLKQREQRSEISAQDTEGLVIVINRWLVLGESCLVFL